MFRFATQISYATLTLGVLVHASRGTNGPVSCPAGPHRRGGGARLGVGPLGTATPENCCQRGEERVAKEDDDVNGLESRRWPKGFANELKYRVLYFSPAWFSCNMAFGIVSILIHNLPYQFRGLVAISLVVFFFNLVLFLIFCLACIVRYTIWRGVWTSMITHPVQSMYLGTFPMGLSTLGDMIVYAVVPAFSGSGFINLAWAIWWIQGTIALLLAIFIPYMMFTKQRHLDSASVTSVWLQPVVSPIIGAAAGSIVAEILPLAHARITVVVCYIMLGLGLAPTFFIFALFFHRLVVHKLPARESIVSLFLPLGPCGQTSFTLLQLAAVLRARPDMFADTLLFDGAFAETVGVVSTIVALWFWGLGLFWMTIAGTGVISTAKSGGVPFNLGWFAFIFPIGTMSTSSLMLSKALNMPAFRVVSMAIAVFVIFFLAYIAFRTAVEVWRGTIFVAPDIGDVEPEMRWRGPGISSTGSRDKGPG